MFESELIERLMSVSCYHPAYPLLTKNQFKIPENDQITKRHCSNVKKYIQHYPVNYLSQVIQAFASLALTIS